jgi:hypothetical protein
LNLGANLGGWSEVARLGKNGIPKIQVRISDQTCPMLAPNNFLRKIMKIQILPLSK